MPHLGDTVIAVPFTALLCPTNIPVGCQAVLSSEQGPALWCLRSTPQSVRTPLGEVCSRKGFSTSNRHRKINVHVIICHCHVCAWSLASVTSQRFKCET